MRDYFINLFEKRQEPFDITLYSVWHILYAVIILAEIIGMAFIYAKRVLLPKCVC